jgi:hypothetical protein
MVSAKPSRYQSRDKKNKSFINQFSKIKKCRGAPGECDPLLGLLDQQAVDEVLCCGAGHHRPTTVRGEPQRLLDDIAEHGVVAAPAALERCGPVTTSTSQRRCRGPCRG